MALAPASITPPLPSNAKPTSGGPETMQLWLPSGVTRYTPASPARPTHPTSSIASSCAKDLMEQHMVNLDQRAQGTGTGSAGGFTIPEGFINNIVEARKAFGGLRNAPITVLSTASGNDLPIPSDDDTSNVGELLAENTQAAEQDVAFGQKVLKAYVYEISKQLSVFVGLIITNCIVMGRAEAFAMQNGPRLALLDGVGNALGYTIVLMSVSFFRELFGSGSVFGVTLMQPVTDGGWYVPNGLMVLAPAAFLLIGVFIWLVRFAKPEQNEEEFIVGALSESGHEGHIR